MVWCGVVWCGVVWCSCVLWPRVFCVPICGTVWVQVRVVKDGAQLSTPLITLTVDTASERGLLGIASHPDFAENGFLYLCVPHCCVPPPPRHLHQEWHPPPPNTRFPVVL